MHIPQGFPRLRLMASLGFQRFAKGDHKTRMPLQRKLDEVSSPGCVSILIFLVRVRGVGGDDVSLDGTHQFKSPPVSLQKDPDEIRQYVHDVTPRITTFLYPVRKHFARGGKGYHEASSQYHQSTKTS